MNNIAGNNMSKYAILDEIIEQLQIEQVPAEFIIKAKITAADGTEIIVSGEELEELIDRGVPLMNVRVILNIKKIHSRVNEESTAIFNKVFKK